MLNKNATLTPNSCDFYDLRNYVAKFCCQNVRTFSADFFGLKTEFRRRYPFLDVCVQYVQFCASVYNLVYVHKSFYTVRTI